MPVHDWTRVPSGLFHHFHQDWSIEIARTLNRGLLPKGISALVEQRLNLLEADVLTIEKRSGREAPGLSGVATLDRPVTSVVVQSSKPIAAGRANRVVIRHHLGRMIAVVEIVSPRNKDTRSALRDFVDKAIELLKAGIHLLVIDLFPPNSRDPGGIHKAIWDEIEEKPSVLDAAKDRTLVSYEAGLVLRTAYIEPTSVGDSLPEMPLFLNQGEYIMVPLESTYQAAWDASPEDFRIALETGIMPEPDAD